MCHFAPQPPIQKKYYSLRKEPSELNQILNDGARKAKELSNSTLQKVKDALGFLPSIEI